MSSCPFTKCLNCMSENPFIHLTSIASILENSANHHVVVLGDVMLDMFVQGHVSRISPEAPIPVLSMQKTVSMAGGAGNVIRNLSTLGVNSTLISVVGDDDERNVLLGHLQPLSNVHLDMLTAYDRPTTVKTRYISGNQQILRVDNEITSPIEKSLSDKVLERYKQSLEKADVIILSDYGKGVLTDDLIQEAICLAQDKQIPVLVDPKGDDYRRYRGATVLTPNRVELELATQMPVKTDEQVVQACTTLIETCGIYNVLATRSEQGMSWVCPNIAFHRATVAQDVADVSGAGDTVIAALACGLACGSSFEAIVHFANTCAGVVVSKLGTAVPHPEEILKKAPFDYERVSKVMTLSALNDLVEQWRGRGLSVGFTNGCFDILHTGHLSLIEQAKKSCDRLILGLNSDDSVRRLGKGEDRPINNENSRATVLSSIGNVDAVVIFDEDTPLNLINTIRPDVLVKGSDYTLQTVVGADEVASWGGRVLLADLIEGQSTTNTLAKIRS